MVHLHLYVELPALFPGQILHNMLMVIGVCLLHLYHTGVFYKCFSGNVIIVLCLICLTWILHIAESTAQIASIFLWNMERVIECVEYVAVYCY